MSQTVHANGLGYTPEKWERGRPYRQCVAVACALADTALNAFRIENQTDKDIQPQLKPKRERESGLRRVAMRWTLPRGDALCCISNLAQLGSGRAKSSRKAKWIRTKKKWGGEKITSDSIGFTFSSYWTWRSGEWSGRTSRTCAGRAAGWIS